MGGATSHMTQCQSTELKQNELWFQCVRAWWGIFHLSVMSWVSTQSHGTGGCITVLQSRVWPWKIITLQPDSFLVSNQEPEWDCARHTKVVQPSPLPPLPVCCCHGSNVKEWRREERDRRGCRANCVASVRNVMYCWTKLYLVLSICPPFPPQLSTWTISYLLLINNWWPLTVSLVHPVTSGTV